MLYTNEQKDFDNVIIPDLSKSDDPRNRIKALEFQIKNIQICLKRQEEILFKLTKEKKWWQFWK